MREPATVLWGLSISDADFKKLKAGFRSSDMNDKWNILAMDQSQSDNIPIHFSRSWTGIEHHILYIKPSDGGSSSGAKIEAITWEQRRNGIHILEEYAKKEAVILARVKLDCDFEALPIYHPSDL
ncbi:hypothetical protein ASPWEDRAFT_453534 [Aspergillus wentii DTO 134E9]|uniref:Uncharacterized protein n=1 Tax=Aspergillus wentii DTO 134E9 TaxID=1073089 RepID=A0A1L9RR48_ASPWE|nr:uncharacterized protein ASPWEDRAFT_453534 [Aspergillus wentii DTO 134E9]KAI9928086.1 hypothetical protein MW887_002119 [Aspergillus wentii]OJJ37436.1 hypothetical protein ASPWEDRAFT_453534 [Aspergillus wentii DTO 134E9]